MINKMQLLFGLCFLLIIQSGCFTASQAIHSGGKSPIFLHITNTENFTFLINGEKILPVLTTYSSKLISENSVKRTYTITSLPALLVKANKPYVALKVVNNVTQEQRNYILKSGLKERAKVVMYFQGAYTLGLANALDVGTSSVYAWPEIDIKP